MVQKGLALRYKENYDGEARMARALGFDFFQLWYYNGALSADAVPEPKAEYIRSVGFPVLLHAVFDMPDYERYGDGLMELVEYFGHKEAVLHPVCKTERITEKTVHTLAERIGAMRLRLARLGVKLYVENNSVIDGFFYTVDDLRVVFGRYPDVGLLLDTAHVLSYDHLKAIVDMRFPECLHIADKRMGAPHEHLALGDGDLDFDRIFLGPLAGYRGRVILEAVDHWPSIERSKAVIDRLFG